MEVSQRTMGLWVVAGCGILACAVHAALPIITLVVRGVRAVVHLKSRDSLKNRAPDGWGQYTPKPGDIIVSTPSKSGTTAVLHMCHQLRVDGAPPTFMSQSEVIRWPELEYKLGLWDDINFPDELMPRIFKSHLEYDGLPENTKATKKIYMTRHPYDKLLSTCHFFPQILGLKYNDIAPKKLVHLLLAIGLRNTIKDLAQWWQHRHDSDVLFCFFDELVENREQLIQRVASFMDIPTSDELVHTVHQQTSHAEMGSPENAPKFDDHSIINTFAELGGWEGPSKHGKAARGSSGIKVRAGGGQGSRQKNREYIFWLAQKIIDWSWQRYITDPFGFADYHAMRVAWATELATAAKPHTD
eukprot:m.65507 g.65507  ORF g.65507 m.65507 type:complete len:357 (-) comp15922_c0_seq1:68-1138(-)